MLTATSSKPIVLLFIEFLKGNSRQECPPASVSFPTREAQTFPSAPSDRTRQARHNPRPGRQKISQAAGVGNSIIIIDARAALPETAFRLRNAAALRLFN